MPANEGYVESQHIIVLEIASTDEHVYSEHVRGIGSRLPVANHFTQRDASTLYDKAILQSLFQFKVYIGNHGLRQPAEFFVLFEVVEGQNSERTHRFGFRNG
jgi:hypothetical protein